MISVQLTDVKRKRLYSSDFGYAQIRAGAWHSAENVVLNAAS